MLERQKRIVLASFFDSENLGDLLIASTLMERLAKYGEVKPVAYGGRRFRVRKPMEGLSHLDEPTPVSGSRARRAALRTAQLLGIREAVSRLRRLLSPDHRRL